MCAQSRSCARPRMRSAASWATRSSSLWSATACCARASRTPRSKSITRTNSSRIEASVAHWCARGRRSRAKLSKLFGGHQPRATGVLLEHKPAPVIRAELEVAADADDGRVRQALADEHHQILLA